MASLRLRLNSAMTELSRAGRLAAETLQPQRIRIGQLSNCINKQDLLDPGSCIGLAQDSSANESNRKIWYSVCSGVPANQNRTA